MVQTAKRPPSSDYPVPDYPHAFRICTKGVPLQGNFTTPASQIPRRDEYNNHLAVETNRESVESKFVKEECKSFHIHFPHFIIPFLPGLVLAPLQWVSRKGKGRICVDCTNGPEVAGSANTSIPKANVANADKSPPVFYQYSFDCHLRCLWRTCITYPTEEILQHCDNIEAAFWRVLYHPNLAIVFAYVFGGYLIIPVGQVFGFRSAPSFFTLLSDLRATVASSHDLLESFPISPLAASAIIPQPPENPVDLLVPAVADALNQPLTKDEAANYSNQTFVDDNGVMAIYCHMRDALHQSLISAFLLFGFPGANCCGACLQAEKGRPLISANMLYLGFLINSRVMTVSWPLYKRKDLYTELLPLRSLPKKKHHLNPKQAASIIGKLRSAIQISPWGVYLSFALAANLK
jgi:hypothetical protein